VGVVEGLYSGESYTLEIYAVQSNGQESDKSIPITLVPAAVPPILVSAVGGDRSITLVIDKGLFAGPDTPTQVQITLVPVADPKADPFIQKSFLNGDAPWTVEVDDTQPDFNQVPVYVRVQFLVGTKFGAYSNALSATPT